MLKKYTVEIVKILKKQAIEAKKDAKNPNNGFNNYRQGVLMGYYSIITLLKHQSFVFCIDQKELGLADINPEIELLGLHKNPNIESEEDSWAIDLLNEKKIIGYLSDTIVLLEAQAIEAKKESDNPKVGSEDYSKGELMAYYRAFSILKEQAQATNIDEEKIGLAQIDSEFFTPLKDIH